MKVIITNDKAVIETAARMNAAIERAAKQGSANAKVVEAFACAMTLRNIRNK